MKLLFICEKMDLGLKLRLDQLTQNNIEASCLVLPKFTLYKDWEKEIIESDSGIDILDKTPILSSISKSLKYKNLLSSLDNYDSINIYKCSKMCAPYLDVFKKIIKSYYITVEDDAEIKNRNQKRLYKYASCLLFDCEHKLNSFENKYAYDEKTLIARDSSEIMGIVDDISNLEVHKFKKYLNLDTEKNIVYCDLGTNFDQQIKLINGILKLSKQQIKTTTFIFDSGASTLVDKERLIEYIDSKSIDFLVPDSLLKDKQKAMLLKISKSCIVLPESDEYNTLYPALYTKNHIYYYGNKKDNKLINEHNIFIDTFENFENMQSFNNDSYLLISELLEKNKITIKKLLHPKVVIDKYLEILKIL